MKQYDSPQCEGCPAKKAYLSRLKANTAYQKRNREKCTEYAREYRLKLSADARDNAYERKNRR